MILFSALKVEKVTMEKIGRIPSKLYYGTESRGGGFPFHFI